MKIRDSSCKSVGRGGGVGDSGWGGKVVNQMIDGAEGSGVGGGVLPGRGRNDKFASVKVLLLLMMRRKMVAVSCTATVTSAVAGEVVVKNADVGVIL